MKICEETVRDAIDSSLSDVYLTQERKQAILAQCRPSLEVKRSRRALPRRVVALAATFALVFCLGCGVLAADPELRQPLSVLGQEALRQLQPVNQVSENQGIRMEVLAAIHDGESASVFLSLQDTEMKGRVDPGSVDTTEISGGFAFSDVVNYEPETQTVLLRMAGEAQPNLENRKVTVSAPVILSGEEYLEPQDTGYTLGELDKMWKAPETKPLPEDTGAYEVSGSDRMDETLDRVKNCEFQMLTPWEQPIEFEKFPWGKLRGAGVVDGELHLLIALDDKLGIANQLEFGLMDENGEPVPSTQLSISLGEDQQLSRLLQGNSLKEYVILPQKGADWENLHLAVGGRFFKGITEGKWSTTFRLEPTTQVVSMPCERDMGGWTATNVRLSPISVTVEGQGEMEGYSIGAELEVRMKDGSTMPIFSSSIQMNDDGSIWSREMFDHVIDLEQVDKVLLNGEPVR